jgi:glycosyltransferase involved in cell wall biosynthesis
MLVSIVIRTYNESRYLAELLSAIHSQDTGAVSVEVVIVDSGSLDSTLDIAQQFNCRITSIEKDKFTFGRSLNVGCDLAKGDYLVFISGHCIPTDDSWLMSLIKPLVYNNCHYSYGRQIGRDSTKYSEMQVFKKYYPEKDNYPQAGFFCNNANSAMPKSVWRSYKFNEDLTGLEDMHLARTLVESGLNVGYSAIACVYHIHLEN